MHFVERQMWKLGDNELFCSLPTDQVDLPTAMETVLSQKKHYSRYREATDFVKQAIAYHVEAAKDAYVDLAVLCATSGLAPFGGWKAEPFASSIPGTTEFVLTKKKATGGYHVSLRCYPVLTDEAEARRQELVKLIEKELDDLGIPSTDRFMRQFTNNPDMTSSEAALKKLEDAPESYREIRSGDRFDKLIVTALNIGGPPPGVARSDTSSLKDIEGRDVDRGYQAGQQINSGPETFQEKESVLTARSTSTIGGLAEVAMAVLSGFLFKNNLEPSVAAGSNRIKGLPWRSFGTSEDDAEMMDAANIVMMQSKGLFDIYALEYIRSFSRGIALHDMMNRRDEFQKLAEGLVEAGFDGPEKTFDANDLRDIGYAVEGDQLFQIFSKTQNGSYRVDMHLDALGVTERIDAFDISSGKDEPIGRFVRADHAWMEDYSGHISWSEKVSDNIANVRHMNNLISSLTSLACVFEDEHKIDNSPTP